MDWNLETPYVVTYTTLRRVTGNHSFTKGKANRAKLTVPFAKVRLQLPVELNGSRFEILIPRAEFLGPVDNRPDSRRYVFHSCVGKGQSIRIGTHPLPPQARGLQAASICKRVETK